MSKTDGEILEKYKSRIKRQNSKIKEKYDRVSATLPKGTIRRIEELGLSINGVINESVLAYLDNVEKGRSDPENINVAFSEKFETPENPSVQEATNMGNREKPEKYEFDGLRAEDWSQEQHQGKVPHPPYWATESTIWIAKSQEWYDQLPFD